MHNNHLVRVRKKILNWLKIPTFVATIANGDDPSPCEEKPVLVATKMAGKMFRSPEKTKKPNSFDYSKQREMSPGVFQNIKRELLACNSM